MDCPVRLPMMAAQAGILLPRTPMNDGTTRRPSMLLLSMTTAAVATLSVGCSLRQLAVNGLAGALAESGDVFASDDDPELVRDALPFALKTIETLLAEAPENPDLLLAACRGFTQYAYAFVDNDAALIEDEDYARATVLRERALRLYLRARDYGMRGLELEQPGVAERLKTEPRAAVEDFAERDVQLLFWTGAAWGAAISVASERPEIVADVDAVRALLGRVLELEETFDQGAIHESMIVIEALPKAMGGSEERAREHFARALELSQGQSVSAYVSVAESLSVANQDRSEFEQLLSTALAIDPDDTPSRRLANLIAQKRARHLLALTDDLFLEPLE